MKTLFPPGYHHNGFVATHAHGHMMYGYTLLVPVNQRVLNKQSKERNSTKFSLSTCSLKVVRTKQRTNFFLMC